MKGANRPQTAIELMKHPDGRAVNNIDESVSTLLNALIPNDPLVREDDRPEITEGDMEPVDE